jgi:cytochrome c peroxidase
VNRPGLALAVLAAMVLPWPAGSADVDALKGAYRRPATPASEPADNVSSAAKVRLGFILFQDRRLSRDAALACVDCHQPEKDWQDGLPRAAGAEGRPLSRRTPPLYDLAWGTSFFRDGRAHSLEEQALAPIEAQDEMAQPLDALVARLEAVAFYRSLFGDAFPESPDITAANIAKAVAAFVRTIESGETPFDRWIAGKEDALDAAAQRGFRLFTSTAGCSACHAGWRLTDDGFHDTGLSGTDPGRGAVTRSAADAHAFRTPGLRNVARRAPYMHDGSVASLRAVVDRYADGLIDRPTLSPRLRGLSLKEDERADLVAFLNSLTDDEKPEPRWSPFR